MKSYFIEAIDTLFFRDGRPFEVGGEANLQVPPAPSTFFGAIRSALIASGQGGLAAFKNGGEHEFRDWVGKNKDSEGFTARLKLKGPLFALRKGTQITRLFPLPRDLLIYEEQGKTYLVPTRLTVIPNDVVTNSNISMVLTNPFSQSAEYQMVFITESLFHRYLAGEIQEPYLFTFGEDVFRVEDVFQADFRIGVALKRGQKNAEQGRLFTMQHMAFRLMPEGQMGFYIESELPDEFSTDTFLRLGGDGKVARLQPITTAPVSVEELEKHIEKTRQFKVYLATPAIFELGWKSRAMHNGYVDEISGFSFALVTAAVGRSEMYGGYDVAVNVPKISFPAVPAGSVFYFKIKEGNARQVLQAFHNQCISDFRKNQGFGYSFVGGIHHV